MANIESESGCEGRNGIFISQGPGETEPESFAGFRRKIRAAEVLSTAMERLLAQLHFSGKVSVIVQNGRVLKLGYEEGYFLEPELLVKHRVQR